MVVILVRHAERQSSGADPSLTAAGKRRAALLAAMFAGSGVTAIFTSAAGRTKQTAAPLAAKVGLTPRQIDDSPAVARTQILAGGACVVVVGHTNTVPEFIEALGGPSGVVIDDHDFDRMFVLTVTPPAAASLLEFRYVSA
jgi:broad specificity phosphatase PhoE